MKTSGRIEDHQVLLMAFCMFDGSSGNIYRTVAVPHGEDLHACSFTVDLELSDRSGTIHIAGSKERPSAG